MHKIALCVCAVLWTGLLYAHDNQSSGSAKVQQATVCFFDFRVESPFGRDETSISRPTYCHYEIDKARFLGLLSLRPDSEFYMPNYIRAKVALSANEIYFIDNNGIVRYGTKRFSIDKVKFTDSLENVKKSAHP